MKNRVKNLLVFCVVVWFAFVAVTAAAQTITGVVTENNEIFTEEGDVYLLEKDEKSAELLDFIGEIVKVTGIVKEQDDEKILKVLDFSVFSEADEEAPAEELEESSDGDDQ